MNSQAILTTFQTPAMALLLIMPAGCAGVPPTVATTDQPGAIATAEPSKSQGQPRADVTTGVPCQPEVTSEDAAVEALIALLASEPQNSLLTKHKNFNHELSGIRAAEALLSYGRTTPWQNAHPDVVPALVNCASKLGMMSELGTTCAESLKRIGTSAIPALLPKITGSRPNSMAFAIYAHVLPGDRIEELLPHYVVACERLATAGQEDWSHGDEHMVDDSFIALRKHRTPKVEKAIKDYPAKNKFQRTCLERAKAELNRKLD